MKKGQSKIEHNVLLLNTIIDELGKRFHKFKKTHEESVEDTEHLMELGGKVGFLVNISSTITKSWNYEKRILALEKDRDNPIPSHIRKEYMFNPDIMLTIVRDNNGKIMN